MSMNSMNLGISVLVYFVRIGIFWSNAVMDSTDNSGSMDVKSFVTSSETIISSCFVLRSLIF